MTAAATPWPERAVSVAVQSDKTPRDYARLATQAQGWGFDGVSVYADLGFQPPVPALQTMAEHSERLVLGPACLNPFTVHPVEIAGQIAALDAVSGGRAYLGLTRGSWLGELHLEQRAPVAALRDTVEIVNRLLAGNTGGYRGQAYGIRPGFRLRYRPLRDRIPVLLGVWGPRGAALAAELADEVKIGGSANPAMVSTMAHWLAEGCRQAGRLPDAVGVVAGAVTVVDHDRAAARALARTEVAMYLDVVAALDPTVTVDPDLLARLRDLLTEGRDSDAGALLPDDLLDRFAFAGNPADLAEHALTLFDAGATRIEFGTPHGLDSGRGLDLLGREVLPRIRSRHPSEASPTTYPEPA
ncbi:LLM class flavin-dependent oxidoreductase [Ornithinicoccus hortensis]|uniref:5,10-methylenetetrahydromethanopterin reductase n=1 Tax=Ornithinicoccus hortensis TaxID=82346 RepID=A0A542YWS9_9MICO|nr:LLM class flavin-dependent oxidoreductase [Ornithinicoccus hortensis]TQL52491.1 5,10-methylenetetrahydromethanopterin reductase [Ornithinicoccus hortensis]